jgi:MinD-like ATPase involved in chromosome partitioning or flagellar assembly
MSKLLLAESAIVDVGSSNVEEIVNRMAQFQGSHENIDYFVVPTVPDGKQLRDTLATIETLADLGVPAKKIQVVMNKVEIDLDPRTIFAPLFKASEETKDFNISPEAVVHQNELYEYLKDGGVTIADLTKRNPSDLKKALKGIGDEDQRHILARQITVCYLAQGVKRELDEVYSAVFG